MLAAAGVWMDRVRIVAEPVVLEGEGVVGVVVGRSACFVGEEAGLRLGFGDVLFEEEDLVLGESEQVVVHAEGGRGRCGGGGGGEEDGGAKKCGEGEEGVLHLAAVRLAGVE